MICLDPVFTDHIVFQCGKPVTLAGSAAPLSEVSAAVDGKRYSVRAGQDGRFTLSLGTRPAGGPFRITVSSSEDETVLEDVLFGDVWIAGGQSNMELRLEDSDPKELTDEPFLPEIRFYSTAEGGLRGWVCLNEQSRLKMSAAAYYFACEIRRRTGNPVGIIDSAIGGTSISGWISEETLKTSEAGRFYLEDFKKQTEGVTEESFRKALAAFKVKADAWNTDTKQYRREHPEKNWTEILGIFGMAPWPEPLWYDSPFCPGYPYKTMIEPVTVCPIKGFIYYQGEADAWNYRNYSELMAMLIGEWRHAWNDEALPFLFVQLPMFRFSASPEDYNWANQRLAQEKVTKTVPGTYMAVLTDQGEPDNIHPTAKRPVGERLAGLALRYVYGLDVEADAPEKESIAWKNGEIRVVFKNTGGALLCASREVKGFEISYDGKEFRPVPGRIEGNCVILTPETAGENRGCTVRYAFAAFCETNLYGTNGLPVKTFHTGMPV